MDGARPQPGWVPREGRRDLGDIQNVEQEKMEMWDLGPNPALDSRHRRNWSAIAEVFARAGANLILIDVKLRRS